MYVRQAPHHELYTSPFLALSVIVTELAAKSIICCFGKNTGIGVQGPEFKFHFYHVTKVLGAACKSL